MKKALATLLKAAALFIILGGFTLFLLFFGLFGAYPVYVTKMIPVISIALFLALSLSGSGYLGSVWKKRIWAAFLCICLLAGGFIGYGAYTDSLPSVDERDLLLWQYQPFQPGTRAVCLDEPSDLHFDDITAARLQMDGATALYPVYAAFAQAVLPEREYPLYEIDDGPKHTGSVACSGTIEAYERLIRRETDIVFAAAPSADQLEQAEQAGMQLHLTPIGREAFVFFVNSKNPVTGLTVEQIQGIYSGEITNWKQVGGKRQSIRPYQRAQNSGSQTMLLRVMGDIPLMEPSKEDVVNPMDGIIRRVANYRNFGNAIGFSFRFYSTEMVTDDHILLLALNGVEPTADTIRDGSYPLASEFYAVTVSPIGSPAPQETDEALAAFLNWILSAQGQEIIERTGYVALNG